MKCSISGWLMLAVLLALGLALVAFAGEPVEPPCDDASDEVWISSDDAPVASVPTATAATAVSPASTPFARADRSAISAAESAPVVFATGRSPSAASPAVAPRPLDAPPQATAKTRHTLPVAPLGMAPASPQTQPDGLVPSETLLGIRRSPHSLDLARPDLRDARPPRDVALLATTTDMQRRQTHAPPTVSTRGGGAATKSTVPNSSKPRVKKTTAAISGRAAKSTPAASPRSHRPTRETPPMPEKKTSSATRAPRAQMESIPAELPHSELERLPAVVPVAYVAPIEPLQLPRAYTSAEWLENRDPIQVDGVVDSVQKGTAAVFFSSSTRP